jgi:carbonic anhydrase
MDEWLRWREAMTSREQRLVNVRSTVDIPRGYRDTPIGHLLQYHNLRYVAREPYRAAELLIGMCMDNRSTLRIPNRFAFTIRTAGGNLRDNEFRIAFTIAVGGVTALAIIGHTDCGMSNLAGRRQAFMRGMVERAGWDAARAAEFFDRNAPRFEIGDEVEFIVREARRIRPLYPKLLVAPLLFNVEDEMLYLVREDLVGDE